MTVQELQALLFKIYNEVAFRDDPDMQALCATVETLQTITDLKALEAGIRAFLKQRWEILQRNRSQDYVSTDSPTNQYCTALAFHIAKPDEPVALILMPTLDVFLTNMPEEKYENKSFIQFTQGTTEDGKPQLNTFRFRIGADLRSIVPLKTPDPKALQNSSQMSAALDKQLIIAIKKHDIPSIKSLIKAGADINFNDINNQTPWSTAIIEGYADTLDILVEAGVLRLSSLYNGIHEYRRVIQQGYQRALQCAIGNNNIRVVKGLFNAGADPNNKFGETGDTLLHHAIQYPSFALQTSSFEIIELLAQAGADLNARRNDGQTALHLATNMRPAALAALIKAGANLEIKDKQGRTAFDVVSAIKDHYPHVIAATALLNAGAHRTSSQINAYYNSATKSAENIENNDFIRALINRGAHIKKDNIRYHLLRNHFEHPEKLQPQARALIIQSILTDFPTHDLPKFLSTDFFQKLAFTGFHDFKLSSGYAIEFKNMLVQKGATTDYETLLKHPTLHTLSDAYGFTVLCELANVKVGSADFFRLYAKTQLTRLLDKCKGNFDADATAQMSALNKVIHDESGNITNLTNNLTAALDLLRPRYSRMFTSKHYIPTDAPEAITKVLIQVK